ncbi:OmpP1/FadL family transporter [Psychrobacter namhaensis]|uniref:OmpP1/FadL family transporter n=1 Tax=Psychrobacter namhaensis TaxID=292734 RepID=UPI0018E0504A|nr:outer membrane protein transport protein [Psychrobacter namhaensis]
MRATFHLKTLTVAVAALSVASVASAAGLDRSGQDITAFLQDGTYAEAVYTYIDADVSGKDSSDNKIDDIAESYDFFRYGVKADINETFSVGVLYDEPFGAAADYTGDIGDNNFIDANGEGTNVEVRTESITGILGAKLGENKSFQVYGGPVAQRVKADVKLRGTAYEAANGYTTHISADQDYGWLAGVAYSKPEIALKAALTYRSEIEHNAPAAEVYPFVGNLPPALGLSVDRSSTIEITTPESVNFDFQTGINPTTLATAKVRWVPWSDFAIVPSLYNDVSKLSTEDDEGLSLVSYDKDQWQVELGLAKRLTPALAVTGNVGWDSGAGNPVTSLGPIEGYYSAGLGAKYNVTENWAVSAGGKYLWFGDAKGQIPTKNVVSNFEDNDGFVLGMKLSYQAQ